MEDHECDGHCADIITSPGKFEGEPAYVRDVLWPMVLDGWSDETIDHSEQCVIDVFSGPFGCDALDSLDCYRVAVGAQDDGFVYHWILADEAAMAAFRAEWEPEFEDDDEAQA